MASGSRLDLFESLGKIAVSPSRSFFVVCASFILGIAAAATSPVHSDGNWLPVVLVVLLAGIVAARVGRFRFVLIVLFALVFGWFRFEQSLIPPGVPTVADAAGRAVRFSGVIREEVIERATSQEIILDNVTVADVPVEGRLLVRLAKAPQVAFGDTVTLRCEAETPQPIEGFRYDLLLQSRGILAVCPFPAAVDIRQGASGWRGALFAFKASVNGTLSRVLPEPHASFASGLLFGGSSAMPFGIRDDFSRTGTSHIVAASGYNVSIFSALLLTLLMRSPLGRRRSVFLVGGLVILYVILAGMTPAVVRAGLMGLVTLAGLALGRTTSMRNVLIFAAALMLLQNPRLLFDDVGFQLSFVATVGLVVFSSRLEPRFTFLPQTAGLREAFVASLSAIIATTPVLLWHFGTFSLVAPLVNLLILPAIPYLMFFSALGAAAGFVSTAAGAAVSLPAWGLSSFVLHVVTWFGAIPFAQVEVKSAHGIAIALCFMLGIIFLWHRRNLHAPSRVRP